MARCGRGRNLYSGMIQRLAWVLALSGAGAAWGAEPPEAVVSRFGGIQTFSKPSRDAVMGFSAPTTVMELMVVGGQRVEEGTILARGQDAEQLAIVKQTKLRAETDAPVRRATKQAELAETEFNKAKQAFDRGGGTEIEVDRARLAWEVAKIDLETAEMNMELERVRLEQAEALLARYRIEAPFDGVIDQVIVDKGRSVGDTEPVLRIVDVDPVWIDVPAPTGETLTLGLEPGSPAWVLVEGPEGPVLVEGSVIEVSPVADYASASRRVRVEAPNAEAWPPGLRVWVRFVEPEGEWPLAEGGGDEADLAEAPTQ